MERSTWNLPFLVLLVVTPLFRMVHVVQSVRWTDVGPIEMYGTDRQYTNGDDDHSVAWVAYEITAVCLILVLLVGTCIVSRIPSAETAPAS